MDLTPMDLTPMDLRPVDLPRAVFPTASPEQARHRQALRLHDVLEKEARRMAQSLHDEAGQLLAAVHLKLDEVTRSVPLGKRDSITALKSTLDQLEGELRRLSHELRPMILEDLGLLPAVEFLRQGIARRTRLWIEVKGSTAGRLPATIETALYRIVHEALGNIASYAQARHVTIEFRQENAQILCAIHDDGLGIDAREAIAAERARLGLAAIRERVEDLSGTVSLRSSQRHGTQMVVTFPLEC